MSEKLKATAKPERKSREKELSGFRQLFLSARLSALELGERISLEVDKLGAGARIALTGEEGKARSSIRETREAFHAGHARGDIREANRQLLEDRKRSEEFRNRLKAHDGDPSLLYAEELEALQAKVNETVRSLAARFNAYDADGRIAASLEEAHPLFDAVFSERHDQPIRERFNLLAKGLQQIEEILQDPLDPITSEQEARAVAEEEGAAEELLTEYGESAPKLRLIAMDMEHEAQQLRVAIIAKYDAMRHKERERARSSRGRNLSSPVFAETELVMANEPMRTQRAQLAQAFAGLVEYLKDFQDFMRNMETTSATGLDTYDALKDAETQLLKLSAFHAPVRERRERIREIKAAQENVRKGVRPDEAALRPAKKKRKKA